MRISGEYAGGNRINRIGTYRGYLYIILDMEAGWGKWRNGYMKLQDNSRFKDLDYDTYPISAIESLKNNKYKRIRTVKGAGVIILNIRQV